MLAARAAGSPSSGALNGAQGGEPIVVSARNARSTRWTEQVVTAGANGGRFTATLQRPRPGRVRRPLGRRLRPPGRGLDCAEGHSAPIALTNGRGRRKLDRMSRALLGATFLTTGVLHFLRPRMYEAIMPRYLPAHRELVYASGVAEIAGGAGVLHARTRKARRRGG